MTEIAFHLTLRSDDEEELLLDLAKEIALRAMERAGHLMQRLSIDRDGRRVVGLNRASAVAGPGCLDPTDLLALAEFLDGVIE